MPEPELHASHPKIAARLKRADGHLRSVIEMIETGRSCLDTAQQLHAVERAVVGAKRELILDHIAHCLDPETEARAQDAEEFRRIARHL